SVECTFDAIDHVGKQRSTLSTKGNGLPITATDCPQYLIAKAANPVLANAPEAHPLLVTMVPAPGMLMARVENLSDAVVKGKARLVEAKGIEPTSLEQPLEFAPGATETIVRFPLASKPGGEYSVGLRVENEAGELLVALPARRYAAVADNVLTTCTVVAEGD